MKSIELEIDGMHCANCAQRLIRVLARSPGVRNAIVSFTTGSAEVVYDPQAVSADALATLIETAGFSVRSGCLDPSIR